MARNKYPEETVQKILDAALTLFLEKGYEQTTILDIVDNMGGMTRGAFYHHFKSKEEVLDALGDKLFVDKNPLARIAQREDLSGLEKIQLLILSANEDVDQRKITLMSLQALTSPTFFKRHLDDNERLLTPWFQEMIEAGVQDGSIQTAHPKLLAQLITFLTNFWTLPNIYPASQEENIEKLFFIKEITDKMGIPLLDEEIITLCLANSEELDIEVTQSL